MKLSSYDTVANKVNLCKEVDAFFFVQLLLLVICPIPQFEHIIKVNQLEGDDFNSGGGDHVKTQFLSDYIFALMFLRLAFVFKWMLNRSSYKTTFVRKICEEHNFMPSNWFIFKKTLRENQVSTAIYIFALSLIVFTFILMVFEVENLMTPSDLAYLNSPFISTMYFVMITLTTIGYGDYSPKTFEGRLIIMIAAIWGTIILALFVSVASQIFEMDDNESRAIDQVEISRQATRLIYKSLVFYQSKKKLYAKMRDANKLQG